MRYALPIGWAMVLALGVPAESEEKGRANPLKAVFAEDFKTFAVGRFKQLGPGEVDQDLQAGTVTLHPGVRWVRPGVAGFTAEYAVTLDFPSLEKDGDAGGTSFGFVLSNGQIGRVTFSHERKEGKVAGVIDIGKLINDPRAPGGDTEQRLRRHELKGDLPNGKWTIRYHHGLVIVKHGESELARGSFETPGAAVLGVTWDQLQGKLTCKGMTLEGSVPPPRPPNEQAQLQEAAKINQRGIALFNQKKFAEALEPAKQASDIYLKVLGEDHHDTANSFLNVATLLQHVGKLDEAKALFERCLKIRNQVLGADHPETALAHLNLGNVLLAQGKRQDAQKHYAECLAVYRQVLGEEHPSTKALVENLRKLPDP
jgi:hypothetical protein